MSVNSFQGWGREVAEHAWTGFWGTGTEGRGVPTAAILPGFPPLQGGGSHKGWRHPAEGPAFSPCAESSARSVLAGGLQGMGLGRKETGTAAVSP